MKTEETKLLFQKAVDKIKSLGYDVYSYPESHFYGYFQQTYGYIVKKDGSQFSYFQLEDPWYAAVRFTTCHKANKECGTGFCCQDHWDAVDIDKITVELIEESFIDPPKWASAKVRKAALQNQWKDFEEFRTSPKYYGANNELIKL